jgi:hypothetical protein
MVKDRHEELWAAACIEAAIPGVRARRHDDGSRPGMHDLDLYRGAIRFGACEVTAAADTEAIELWNLVNGGGRWIEPELRGGWMLSLSPTCRVKKLKAGLPGLLRALESQGVKEAERARPHGAGQFARVLNDLGIVRAHQGPTSFPGSVYFTIDLPTDRSGGWVQETGDALAEWLSVWTSDPEQGHNIDKLRRARTEERHLFVLFPGFTQAPFGVTDVLMRPDGPLPTVPPILPEILTHVWAMSSWSSGALFRWSASEGYWSRHTKDVGTAASGSN